MTYLDRSTSPLARRAYGGRARSRDSRGKHLLPGEWPTEGEAVLSCPALFYFDLILNRLAMLFAHVACMQCSIRWKHTCAGETRKQKMRRPPRALWRVRHERGAQGKGRELVPRCSLLPVQYAVHVLGPGGNETKRSSHAIHRLLFVSRRHQDLRRTPRPA